VHVVERVKWTLWSEEDIKKELEALSG